MKFTIAIISALAASTSADLLGQNEVCGNNREYERDCQDGLYHVVVDIFRLVNFGCSLKPVVKHVTYSNPDCSFGQGDGRPSETAKARSTCDGVAGTLCQRKFTQGDRDIINYCIMLDDNVETFESNCNAIGGTVTDHANGVSYKDIMSVCGNAA